MGEVSFSLISRLVLARKNKFPLVWRGNVTIFLQVKSLRVFLERKIPSLNPRKVSPEQLRLDSVSAVLGLDVICLSAHWLALS